MLKCPNDKWQERMHRDEGGAIAMLCLAAALILLLMAWVLYDTIMVTNHKIDTQGSADMAAFSHASVKARSMNMMAFTNVGKRSLVGVHLTYYSMMYAYQDWLFEKVAECSVPNNPACDMEELIENLELFERENDNDFVQIGQNAEYLAADLRALDNYQQYLMAVAPWWAWSEAVARAQRNGATLASSVPVPRGGFEHGIVNLVSQVSAATGPNTAFNLASRTDRLPLKRLPLIAEQISREMDPNLLSDRADPDERETRGWFIEGMANEQGFLDHEHDRNVEVHRSNSELAAATDAVIGPGSSFTSGPMSNALRRLTVTTLGPDRYRFLDVYYLEVFDREANWLAATSTVVLTYRHQPDYFEHMRDKYRAPGVDHDIDPTSTMGRFYQPGGLWGLARSEISFQDEGAPNAWSPAWTARMRPLALPGEFREAPFDFNGMYHAAMPYLALSAGFHDNVTNSTEDIFDELVYMERVTRAMGASTIDGVGR